MKGSTGGPMVIKYPKRRTSRALKDINAKENDICPLCKVGKLKLRKSKFEHFLGCGLFPKCDCVVKWY